ncbi:MAG: hypothetical protein ACPG5T_07360, partial [Endozoicomonas sp.]
MMVSLKRWLYQASPLLISVTTTLPVMSAPAISPTSLAPALTSPATKPPLPHDCLNIKDPSTGVISPPLSEAAKKTLDDIRDNNPNIRIDDCVALWIDENRSLDQQVWFNENSFTALLLFDKGINPKQLEVDDTCLKEGTEEKIDYQNNTTGYMVVANTTTESLPIKRKYFTAKKTIELESDIRIIGVPLKEDNSLAEGHFVGIDHYFEEYENLDESSSLPQKLWSALSSKRQVTFKVAEHNVFISGVTFWPIAHVDKGYSLANKGWHGEYVNVAIDEEEPSTAPVLTLYRNQFVAMAVPPVKVSHTANSSYSDYLYSFKENQFISCYSQTSSPGSAIKFTYNHQAERTDFDHSPRKTIAIVNNHYHGQYFMDMISLTLPDLTEALVQGNQYYETREDSETRGTHENNGYRVSAIRLHGETGLESDAPPPFFDV